MPLFINILILNPDEFVAKKAGETVLGAALGSLATNIVDHNLLTETVALAVKTKAQEELRDKHFLDVEVKVKESYSLYCVIELLVKSVKKVDALSFFDGIFGACCETDVAATFVTERAMAMALPGSLKKALRDEGIEADVVVVREISKQEEYEQKVLDLLYSHLDTTTTTTDASSQGQGAGGQHQNQQQQNFNNSNYNMNQNQMPIQTPSGGFANQIQPGPVGYMPQSNNNNFGMYPAAKTQGRW